MSKIELTTKQLFGYTTLVIGITVFVYVIAYAVLLANGTVTPIKVAMENPGYGNDVMAGIILQIGLFAVLAGIAFGLARIGIWISKE